MSDQQEKTAAGEAPILIKKYPNRRLYNTATSKYIVLDDIVELVKGGVPFTVEDKKTGEDITRSILNQVIFERETQSGQFHFPLDVQKQLIAMYDDAYGRMVPDYLRESMRLFTDERERVGDAMGDVIAHNTRTMVDMSQKLAQQNMELFRKSWEAFAAFGAQSGQNTGVDGDENPVATGEGSIAEKKRKLDELEAQIRALKEEIATERE